MEEKSAVRTVRRRHVIGRTVSGRIIRAGTGHAQFKILKNALTVAANNSIILTKP